MQKPKAATDDENYEGIKWIPQHLHLTHVNSKQLQCGRRMCQWYAEKLKMPMIWDKEATNLTRWWYCGFNTQAITILK